MAGLSTGLKKKLTISPCTVDSEGIISVDGSKDPFEVMLNPSSYSHNYTIKYNKDKTMGQASGEPKFSAICPEEVTFDLLIDGTGVVNLPIPGVGSPDVKTQMEQLEEVVYHYDGTHHEPNNVRLLWGSMIFFGRLKSMSVEYNLFKPSGEPLRAKLKLAFTGYMSQEEGSLKAKRSSPDLTHYIEFKAGDSLPLLCYSIYRDSSYYLEVAKVNKITNFRNIKPGTRLYFPPLS